MVASEHLKEGLKTCEGLVLRLKPDIDLRTRDLSSGCLAIATALQQYGAIVGDTTANAPMRLKVENLILEGTGNWSDYGVTTDCFEPVSQGVGLTFDDFVVIEGGYDRPPQDKPG